MSRTKWNGNESTKARKYWEPRLPVPCCRCGKPVVPIEGLRGKGWQVDHWPVPREFGGTEMWPAHADCNMSAGGKRGAEITNARRRERVEPTARIEPNPIRW